MNRASHSLHEQILKSTWLGTKYFFFPRYSFDFKAATDRMRDESEMRIKFKI